MPTHEELELWALNAEDDVDPALVAGFFGYERMLMDNGSGGRRSPKNEPTFQNNAIIPPNGLMWPAMAAIAEPKRALRASSPRGNLILPRRSRPQSARPHTVLPPPVPGRMGSASARGRSSMRSRPSTAQSSAAPARSTSTITSTHPGSGSSSCCQIRGAARSFHTAW